MILGIGTDITGLERVRRILARFGPAFARRVLSPEERGILPPEPRRLPHMAGRWAAKEACAKALGTGFAEGIGPDQIQIFNTKAGAPEIVLTGRALARFEAMGCRRAHLSLSHDTDHAVAVVILED